MAEKRKTGCWVGLGIAVLVLVIAASAVWIAYTGLQAKRALESAADALSGAQSALLAGDVEAADTAVTEASVLTTDARAKTSDPVWSVVGAIPYLGATPRTVTLSSQAADDVISGALPKFVAAARVLDISTIKYADGTVDLARLPETSTQLASATADLEKAAQALAEAPTSGVIGVVSEAKEELSAEVDQALGVSTTAASLLGITPQLLGANGPQTYFVAFQSPVEIRGTGGFLGSFGILTMDGGKLVQKDVAGNSDLTNFPNPVVDMGPDYRDLYGEDSTEWVNMNMSPNFPYAGIQWQAAWQRQSGVTPAGVVSIDVSAMQSLLAATGPVTAPDGRKITADNAIPFFGNEIYREFANDNGAREDYQAEVATILLERVIGLEGKTQPIVEALTESVSGGHLQMWSGDPSIQSTLAATPIGGETPTASGPYAQLVLNNGGGNKLDYFLQRQLTYTSGKCEGDMRSSTITATLTNTVTEAAADGLPSRSGLVNRVLTYVHLPIGGGVTQVRIDGQPAQASFGREKDRTVALFILDLPPGDSVTVDLDVLEPVSDAAPVVPVQPMITEQETTVNWSGC